MKKKIIIGLILLSSLNIFAFDEEGGEEWESYTPPYILFVKDGRNKYLFSVPQDQLDEFKERLDKLKQNITTSFATAEFKLLSPVQHETVATGRFDRDDTDKLTGDLTFIRKMSAHEEY